MTRARRFSVVFTTIAILMFAVVGTVNATVTSKTITTTNGECVNSANPPTLADGTTACGAAVYGADGFTGTITGSGVSTIVDYICVHTPGGQFVSYGGTYTFTLYDAGGAILGTTLETVTDGVSCTDGLNAVTAGSITYDFGTGSTVTYSVLISGVTSATAQATFAGYNSILNRVFDTRDRTHAQSPSVAPPGPPGDVPEAPAAILLVLSAGLVGFWFVRRQVRSGSGQQVAV